MAVDNVARLVLVGALVSGCFNPRVNCVDDNYCGAGGRCELSVGGFCSFPDSTCPSGWRFGELAGGQSNVCVGVEQLPIDAAVDAPPDVPPEAGTCFGGPFLTICLQMLPMTTVTFSTPSTLNTDTSQLCVILMSVTNNGNYCVVIGTDITIVAKLRAVGTRPLVLLASGTIVTTTAGLIDVGSHRIQPQGTTEKGAGADPTVCGAGVAPGATGGGGAGGSYFGKGGNGGTGGIATGTGGQPPDEVSTVEVLRGGCPGQNGQGATAVEGLAGSGGGAVYLIAGVGIDVQGEINAAGEGGVGGASNVGGGGGGGSGGMIGFDAPTITGRSLLLASGAGGGGGGGSGGGNTTGGTGTDPLTTTAATRGTGFFGNGTFGGDGGDGSPSIGTNAAGSPGLPGDNAGTNRGGGGGGGGGTGVIKAPEHRGPRGESLTPANAVARRAALACGHCLLPDGRHSRRSCHSNRTAIASPRRHCLELDCHTPRMRPGPIATTPGD